MQGKLTSSSNMVTTYIYEPIVFTEILSIRDDHYGSLVCVYICPKYNWFFFGEYLRYIWLTIVPWYEVNWINPNKLE